MKYIIFQVNLNKYKLTSDISSRENFVCVRCMFNRIQIFSDSDTCLANTARNKQTEFESTQLCLHLTRS